VNELRFRVAGPDDAAAVTALHADSWQRHYHGAFSDTFLGQHAEGYLLPLWTERLATTPDPMARTILAERDGAVVGMATRSCATTPPGAPSWTTCTSPTS
jgi:hypothetical protein